MEYLIFLLPALILSMYAQSKVQSTFKKFSSVRCSRGVTADEVARQLLMAAGVTGVSVERIAGNLTDHYDPRSKTIRLSEGVYGKSSISAIGVAAHETGHACQDYEGYAPLSIRSAFVPIAGFGSKMAMPLIMIGIVLGASGNIFVAIGILLFTAAVLFQIITLPVEFNASNRALRMVESAGILSYDETDSARKVLNAAALTYVAAAAVAVASLIRLLLMARRRR